MAMDDTGENDRERRDEADEEPRDLGFGETVARESRVRLLNRDGSFNVRRSGIPLLRSVSIYSMLQRIEWWQFYLLVGLAYLCLNLVFAGAFLLCGPGAVEGVTASSPGGRFLEAFFFSVHTLTTVGYGTFAPRGVAANALVAVEALLWLGGFAVVAAVIFARLARPRAEIEFSETAVIAPYGDGEGFMLRLVNARKDQLVQVEAEVVFTCLEGGPFPRRRGFHRLELERDRITFFPLHWTIVHPIGDDSPLAGLGPDDLARREAEFLVQITAVDEMHDERVRARTSYRPGEIEWGARFADIFEGPDEGVIGIDVRRVHETEPVEEAEAGEPAEVGDVGPGGAGRGG